jgi:hypothetical protein
LSSSMVNMMDDIRARSNARLIRGGQYGEDKRKSSYYSGLSILRGHAV